MRIHIPGLPHTETIKDWSTCAFTQKTVQLSNMLYSKEYEIFLYSGENNDAKCAEHIIVSTEEDRRRWFGDETWKNRAFNRWKLDDPCWIEYNNNVISAMMVRVEPGDVLALPMGMSHKQIRDAFPDLLSFESGIGYEAIVPEMHHVFESYAWMHNRYGVYGITDGRFYDTVIPNAFDPDDFYVGPKNDYVLFLGRHTTRKGLVIVEEIAKHHRVITAGQVETPIKGTEYVGIVKGNERAKLISEAKALIAPTIYIEPFGGVVVEAQMSGTVPITTDFGAFTETIDQHVSGFRCHTLQEFLDAVEKVGEIDPVALRRTAVERYSIDSIASQYDTYLKRLNSLFSDGWYERSGS